jgi:hypothetical protein
MQYASAAGTIAAMTAQFFSGLGSSDQTFDPGSMTSQAMAQSAGVQDVLDNYYMTGRTSGGYTFGASGLIAAGNNLVAQFVGSFSYNITPGNGGINLSLSNYTSVHSLTNGLFNSHPRSSFSPLGPIHQTYNMFIPCKTT